MRFAIWSAVLGALVGTQSLWAQCTTIDFDDLAVGTVVTDQYSGVRFSGRSPEGNPSFDPIIYNPNGPTSSEPQCLSAQGNGGFSQEFIRVDFDRNQTEVTFTLGVRFTNGACHADDTIAVRYYEFVNNAYTWRGTFQPVVSGALATDRVYVFVRVTRPNNQTFRRLEIEGDLAHGCGARFELIDDLTFDIDATPPAASLDFPPACVCNGTSVTGTANDPDGDIRVWQLHRRQLLTPGANWVLVRQSTTEVLNGELGPWNTAAPDGYYTLRLRVTNECGLVTEAFTDVYLDRAFNAVAVRSPAAGAVVGGAVCVDGTVSDHCDGDFIIERRPAGGAFALINAINAPWVTNDPLGSWNTRAGTPDGNYELRVTATDDCGNTAAVLVGPVVVDNTPPVAVITNLQNCEAVGGQVQIIGTVSDAHLAGWELQYTGGPLHRWERIAQGAGNVANGPLGVIDFGALPPCGYTLRLVATDASTIDCGAARNQTEYLVTLDSGIRGDLNCDGVVNNFDIDPFVMCVASGICGCQ
jgi:hypothetical protein